MRLLFTKTVNAGIKVQIREGQGGVIRAQVRVTSIKYPSLMGRTKPCAVPDPDLEIRGGGGSSRPLDKGKTGPPKISFRPFGPQFGPKIRGGGAPPAPPLDPPLVCYLSVKISKRVISVLSWTGIFYRKLEQMEDNSSYTCTLFPQFHLQQLRLSSQPPTQWK